MFNFKFSFWGLFFEVKERFMQIFKKILIFKVLAIFENENFVMRATHVAKFANFWELNS